MEINQLLEQLIKEYGTALWIASITIVISTMVLISLKDFATNIVNYFSVKMSDFGEHSIVSYNGKTYIVKDIKLTSVVVENDYEVVIIPIKKWLSQDKIMPKQKLEGGQNEN